jgi:hypothetical protein
MGKLNAKWHQKHRMPKNPTHDQRMAWHAAHARACGCRPMPHKLAAELARWRRERSAPHAG